MLDIGSVIGTAWLLGFWLMCLVGWLDSRSARPKRPSAEVARLNEYRSVIDALYDRAEQEVDRVTRQGHGG